MSRLGLALMLMAALVATSFAWPVGTKKEEGLSVAPLQKSEQPQEPLKVAQETAEIKDVQEPKEQLQIKSAPSEAIEKAEINGLKTEEAAKQEHKEDIKNLQEEPKEIGLSDKVMQPLQKGVAPQPAEAAAPAVAEPAKEIAQPATVQETIIEKKAEAKSSDVASEQETKPSEVKEEGAQVKTIVEDVKPAEPEQTPDVIEPVAEPKQVAAAPASAAAPAQIADKVKSEPIQEPAKIDDKSDRVTREAEEAAKKLAQQKEQQQTEEKKEVTSSSKVPKSQDTAQQPAEKPVVAEEKIQESAHQEQPALPVEASVAEHSEPKAAATEQQTGAKVESEGQQASPADGSSQPLLKLNGIHEHQEEPAAVESAAPVEKVAQEGTQQIVDEVKAEVKEAKSAEQEPIKPEELPKPEEVKKEMKPETLSDEVKRPEKLPKHSSEEVSEEEKSSEEKSDKTGNSSEEMNEKEVRSSRSLPSW